MRLEDGRLLCSKECEVKRRDGEKDASGGYQSVDMLQQLVKLRDAEIEKLQLEFTAKVEELHSTIVNLSKEKELTGACVEGQRQRKQDFGNDAVPAKFDYMLEVGEGTEEVAKLCRENLQLLERNSSLQSQILEMKCRLGNLQRDIDEFGHLRENMLTTIETLTQENNSYADEVKQLKRRVFDVMGARESSAGGDQKEVASSITVCQGNDASGFAKERMLDSSRRILILCDEHGRDVDRHLRQIFSANLYKIQTFIKPGAQLYDIVVDVEKLTCDYTQDDHVVIVAGANDLENRRFPSFSLMLGKLRKLSHTNVSFVSVPYFSNAPLLNCRIYKYNLKLFHFVNRLDSCTECTIGYFDFNCEDRMKLRTKAVSRSLSDFIINGYRAGKNKNLIFVKVQNLPQEKDTRLSENEADDQSSDCFLEMPPGEVMGEW